MVGQQNEYMGIGTENNAIHASKLNRQGAGASTRRLADTIAAANGHLMDTKA